MVWFNISSYPTLILVGRGKEGEGEGEGEEGKKYRVYGGERSEEAIGDFLVDAERELFSSSFSSSSSPSLGFAPLPPPPSPLLISLLHLQDWCLDNPLVWTLLCAVVGCVVGFAIVVCFGDRFLDDEEEEGKKEEKKKKKE